MTADREAEVGWRICEEKLHMFDFDVFVKVQIQALCLSSVKVTNEVWIKTFENLKSYKKGPRTNY